MEEARWGHGTAETVSIIVDVSETLKLNCEADVYYVKLL